MSFVWKMMQSLLDAAAGTGVGRAAGAAGWRYGGVTRFILMLTTLL
jgi:hypothetical protein